MQRYVEQSILHFSGTLHIVLSLVNIFIIIIGICISNRLLKIVYLKKGRHVNNTKPDSSIVHLLGRLRLAEI